MTIDELIDELEKLRDEHDGDVQVEVRNGAGDYDSLRHVEINRDKNGRVESIALDS